MTYLFTDAGDFKTKKVNNHMKESLKINMHSLIQNQKAYIGFRKTPSIGKEGVVAHFMKELLEIVVSDVIG